MTWRLQIVAAIIATTIMFVIGAALYATCVTWDDDEYDVLKWVAPFIYTACCGQAMLSSLVKPK